MVKNNYSVLLTNVAKKDLDDIYDYISEELFAESAAANILGQIKNNILNLAIFPYSGSLLSDEYLKIKGYRRVIVGSFIIFYLKFVSNTLYCI